MQSLEILVPVESAHPVLLILPELRLGKRWRDSVVGGLSTVWSVSYMQEYTEHSFEVQDT